MKNRLTITISDVHSTKSYSVHRLVKKVLIGVLLVGVLLTMGSFLFISYLSYEIQELKEAKEQEIQKLTQTQQKLITQNRVYSMQIQDKINDIEELSTTLDDIEEIIGIKQDPKNEPDILQRAKIAKMTGAQKAFMLQIIPNGSPLEKVYFTSEFGYRTHPVTKKRRFHRGLDFRAKRGTKVFATADGVVNYVRSKDNGGFGRVVKVFHNYGFETVYAHLKKPLVQAGDVVKKGDVIGLSGNSGRSTGPHLHYEVRYARHALDPKDFVQWSMKEYESIFETQRRVKWESLVNLIKMQSKKLAQQ